MRRFFRSAAFPILIVIVLAFFAQQLISPDSKSTTPSFNQFLGQIESKQIDQVTVNTKDNTLDVKQTDGKNYSTGYPDNYEQPLVNDLTAKRRQDRGQGQGRLEPALAAHLHPSLPPLLRLLDLPDEPDARRRLAGDELRQVAGQADVGGRAEDHLPRRRRGRRGRPGAARDQGVPREPEEVPGARRPDPEGRAALRAARHRQDAARPRRRRRGRRALLLDLGLRLRRDVRRRRRQPRPRPLRAGQAELPLHHLHGRDRRRRPPPRRRHGRRPRRARADPEPAAGRDGRLRDEGQHHPDRRHQPARHPRPGAAAARPLRPPDRRRPPRPQGPQEDPRGPHARQAARQGHRPRHARRPDPRLHRRRPRQPDQRGGAADRPLRQARDHDERSSRRGSCA